MGHGHLQRCYGLFVAHTALFTETFLVLQSKFPIQIVHLHFLQQSRAPSCKAQRTPFALPTRFRVRTSVCRRRVPVAPGKLPQPNHHLGPASIQTGAGSRERFVGENTVHPLNAGRVMAWYIYSAPPCLEYIFLSDLCICAVRQTDF